MYFGYGQIAAKQEYYEDQKREAAKYRLVRQALAGRKKGTPFYAGILTGLGRCLVAWGSSLQKHHGVTTRTPVPQSANQMAGG